MGVVLGAVVLLVALSILTSGGDDEDGAEAPAPETTSTTNTRPPTTERPGGPSSSVPVEPVGAGEVLDDAFGLAAVVVGPRATLTVIDLATGSERTVDLGEGNDRVEGVNWTGETLVAHVGDGALGLRRDGPIGWDPVDMDGHAVMYGDGTTVFVQPRDQVLAGRSMPTAARFVGSDPVELRLIATGRAWSPLSLLDDDRLVMSTLDGWWLVDADGSTRRLPSGHIYGGRGSFIARAACESPTDCRLFLDDLDTGTSRSLGPLPDPDVLSGVVPAPDGSAVAIFGQDPDTFRPLLRVVGGDGSELRSIQLENGGWIDPTRVMWGVDSRGLVWVDEGTRSVYSVAVDGDLPPSRVRLRGGISESGMGVGILLVPADGLRSDIRPD